MAANEDGADGVGALRKQTDLRAFQSPPLAGLRESVPSGRVAHPLLRADVLEAREYQLTLARQAVERSLLVVLPTGLGKTAIAVLAAAEILRRQPDAQVLVLAPTRPLVLQHAEFFRATLDFPEDATVALTGRNRPDRRAASFANARVVVSTPQGLANDVREGRVSLTRVALLVVDEAHRAVGNYAYVPLTRALREANPEARVLGLTASPGGASERVAGVVAELGVDHVEARAIEDVDVRRYVRSTGIAYRHVAFPETLQPLRQDLQALLEERVKKIRPFLPRGAGAAIGKKALLGAGDAIRKAIGKPGARKGYYFASLLHQGVAVQALHALELLETQGLHPLRDYLDRVSVLEKPSRAQKSFLKDARVARALEVAKSARESHPKEAELVAVVREQHARKPASLILVFAQYRDTVRSLVERVREAGVPAARFVGQADRGEDDSGLTQDEQARILKEFASGSPRVLVATSVAEEGLHIPAVDLVVFYEPVPSEIRTIQRRGRTGRDFEGRVVVLVTKGTRDEAFLRACEVKEERMRRVVQKLNRDGT